MTGLAALLLHAFWAFAPDGYLLALSIAHEIAAPSAAPERGAGTSVPSSTRPAPSSACGRRASARRPIPAAIRSWRSVTPRPEPGWCGR
jgi:hypothetical protein